MKRFLRRRECLLAIVLLSTADHFRATSAEDKTVMVSEQDLRAAVTQKVEPEYPAVARQIRLTGSVELEILVDLAGGVERANAVKGNTLLTGPSLQAIRKWKFRPFRTESEPAKAAGTITFTFQM